MTSFLAALLVLASIIALVVGALYLSQATLGAGIIGAAAVLGILGRIAQSQAYHTEQMEALDAVAAALGMDKEEALR